MSALERRTHRTVRRRRISLNAFHVVASLTLLYTSHPPRLLPTIALARQRRVERPTIPERIHCPKLGCRVCDGFRLPPLTPIEIGALLHHELHTLGWARWFASSTQLSQREVLVGIYTTKHIFIYSKICKNCAFICNGNSVSLCVCVCERVCCDGHG